MAKQSCFLTSPKTILPPKPPRVSTLEAPLTVAEWREKELRESSNKFKGVDNKKRSTYWF